jgi:muramoyltetrapeptide carboxypeptidase
VKPPRLRDGDTIGLISTGTRLSDDWIARRRAQRAGGWAFGSGWRPNVQAVHGHYSGTVRSVWTTLHALWADPEVRALWSVRGGAGTAAAAAAPGLGAMRRDPKPVLGYSDVTALHLGLLRHAGLVCFHTLAAVSRFTPYSLGLLRAVLMQGTAPLRMERSAEHRARADAEAQYRARTVRAGVAEGPLVGGNLSVLSGPGGHAVRRAKRRCAAVPGGRGRTALPHRPHADAAGAGRPAARRRGPAGGRVPRTARPRPTPTVHACRWRRPSTRASGLPAVPAVYGYSFGHVRDQITLPLGVRARLDTADETLTLLEPAVS